MPEPGDVLLGRFRIESVIGQGGMGLVFGARVLPNETPVAIKVLSLEASTHPEGIPRFINEARATTKLSSAHVVKVFEAGTLDAPPLPFIVMERLQGTDLGAIVDQRGALSIRDAVDYVIQAADAVAEAHAHGIVHRDLKPSNLFLAERPGSAPMVKVLDFGVSKVAPTGPQSHALTSTGTFLGSPHYMSPEQLKSARDVDARADIWSLGVILYELLTSRPPFDGGAFGELMMKVLAADVPSLRAARPEVPEALEQVIVRCLRRPREERFPDLASLARALAPFASPEGARAAERVGRPPSARMPIGAPVPARDSPRALASTAIMPGNIPPASSRSFGTPQTPHVRPGDPSSGALPRFPPSNPALASHYAAGQAPQPHESARNVWGAGPAPSRGPSPMLVAIAVGAVVFALVGLVLIVLALRARAAHAGELDRAPPALSSSAADTRH